MSKKKKLWNRILIIFIETIILLKIDYKIFKIINQDLAAEWLDPLMICVSSEAFGALFAAIIFMFALYRRDKPLIVVLIMAAVALALVDFLSYQYLKPFFGRLRPCQHSEIMVRQVLGCAGIHGFPSNHAANSMAVCSTFYFFTYRRLAVLAGALALLVGCSRVYLGVHYPADIAAGYLAGGVVGWSLAYICRPLFQSKTPHQS